MVAKRLDYSKTHIMESEWTCYNVETGERTTHLIPSPVRRTAYRSNKVVTERVRTSGKNRGKTWYSSTPIQDTNLTRDKMEDILPSDFSKWVLDRLFGAKIETEKVDEPEPTPPPKPQAEMIPALMDLATKSQTESSAVKKVTEVDSVDVDPDDEQKIIETIHSAEQFKPDFLKMSDLKWRLLIRTVLRGKNIMLTGPSGEGKTLSVHAVKASLGRPFFYINLGNMQDPQTALIGKTHFVEGEGTKFVESYFVKALKTPNAIILLDEFSRLNDDAENILMSVLDYNQRYLRLTEDEDSETVKVAPGVCFIATANLGNEYTSTKVLDRAMLDRFSRIEIEELDKRNRVKLMQELFPNVPKQKIRNIAELADKISMDYHSDSPTVENLISTRMCVETAEYLNDGFLLSEAVEATVYPFFDKEGGAESQRAFVKQIVQSFGTETRPTLDGSSNPVDEVEEDRPLFGDDDFDILK